MPQPGQVRSTWSPDFPGAVTFNANLGTPMVVQPELGATNYYIINVTGVGAITVGPCLVNGQVLTANNMSTRPLMIEFFLNFGGVMAVPAWDASFKPPAGFTGKPGVNGKRRSINWRWNGTLWMPTGFVDVDC